MKFRRSVKSEKHDSAKPVQISIPQKDAIAIDPPKKVIKALYDWDGHQQNEIYLSFSTGDFLHVVGRETDTEWYEACNPLKNERGLVPVKFFDSLGKTVRDSGDSSQSIGATHDSGYVEGTNASSRSLGAPRSSHSNDQPAPDMPTPGHRSSKSVGKAGAGLYGLVSYDFHAERPDELDAKVGEAIIVIAQSNPEWFVAKPITRLGGPGLIPVSFVQLRDMTTGRAVEDVPDAVRKANIPRVEEWKKMAADYKNTSIPLGMVTSSTSQGQSGQTNGAQMHDHMNRLSLNNGHQNGYGHSYGHSYGHDRQGSSYNYQQQRQQNLFAPVRASVPRYIFADDKFQFIVECRLSNGTHWDLSRIYEDFYELQINLINAFPEEAGQVPGRPRILPYMPGPVKYVTDNISEGRRANLDEYLRDLLRLQQHITCSSLVRNFFSPRPGDYEVDPQAVDLEEHARAMQEPDRQSQHSYQSQQQHQFNGGYQQPQQQRYPPNQQQSYPYGSPQPNGYNGSNQYGSSLAVNQPYHHQNHSAGGSSGGSTHYRSPSDSLIDPLQAQNQGQSPGNQHYQKHHDPHNQQLPIASTGPVKVKAWFDRDTCVVIRMPPRGKFDFDQLYQKLVERRRLEYKENHSQDGQFDEDGNDMPLDIEYRDERDGGYYRLEGDEDLEIAVERCEKLTLAVRKRGELPVLHEESAEGDGIRLELEAGDVPAAHEMEGEGVVMPFRNSHGVEEDGARRSEGSASQDGLRGAGLGVV